MEMTQEEKAKAYDRVSKEVKDFLEGKQKLYSDITKTLEYLFPELKESKDERIKREILELVSIAGNGNQFEEIKDWLEKQCEQKSTIEMKSAEESLSIDSETYNKIVDECIFGDQSQELNLQNIAI